MLSHDGDPTVTMARCADCGDEHETSTGFVLLHGSAHAAYWVSWYPHHEEAWVDMVVGSWQGPDYPDHATFGCRIGRIEGTEGPQCSLVHGGARRGDAPILGHKLTREEALADPRIDAYWECIDWLMFNDPVLHEHVYHMD